MKNYFENLYTGNFEQLIYIIKKNLQQQKKHFIITANSETYMIANRNSELRKVVLNSNYTVVADGIGVIKGCHILKTYSISKIPGIEIAKQLLEIGNRLHLKIALLGAKEEVVTLLIKKIKQDYPNLNIIGFCNGYQNNKQELLEHFISREPDIILIALGIPHQELLIHHCYQQAKKGIFVGVGGSFDVLSGFKRRAPKIFQKTNTEWLYRIIREPKRIKRFYNNNVKFFQIVNKESRIK